MKITASEAVRNEPKTLVNGTYDWGQNALPDLA